ncbi:MAG TPA: hypothetical protein VEB21_11575 [Terriglobales bacterium]|nr:hypothetical protein [Terriglobales bacterium]
MKAIIIKVTGLALVTLVTGYIRGPLFHEATAECLIRVLRASPSVADARPAGADVRGDYRSFVEALLKDFHAQVVDACDGRGK